LGLDCFVPRNDTIPDEVKQLAEMRLAAKLKKDWTAADAVRELIHIAGWEIMDTKDGYNLTLRRDERS